MKRFVALERLARTELHAPRRVAEPRDERLVRDDDVRRVAVVVVLENLAGGMGTTALVALIMGLCNKKFTATQFALLTALSAVGRYIAGPTSGYIVASTGWTVFFFITALTAIPGLALLFFMRKRVLTLDAPNEEPSASTP